MPDTTLTFVNEAYCRRFDRPREELIGHKFLELIPESARAITLRNIASVLERRQVLKQEHEVMLPDGTVGWQQWADYVVGCDDGEVELQGIGQDITDRKRAEEARQTLSHASRLAVVGELTAMIAHEINQPLGAILSNADAAELLLRQKEPPLREIREILADIRKNDIRASETIRRMRALQRRREMDLHPIDINQTVAEVLRLVASDAQRRGVRIETGYAAPPPSVRGDTVHLQQVLLNLILNAMDAMAELSESRRRIGVRVERDGTDTVKVAVEDTGPGVPPDRLPRIFESFFTTKKEGMGLGLSIARSIIEAHQGHIWVERNCNGMTVFPLLGLADQPRRRCIRDHGRRRPVRGVVP